MSRRAVTDLLTSQEADEVIKQAEDKATRLVDKAIAAVEEILDDPTDNSNRLKAALAVLRTKGLLRENAETKFEYPAPMIVTFQGKKQFVMGVDLKDADLDDDVESD